MKPAKKIARKGASSKLAPAKAKTAASSKSAPKIPVSKVSTIRSAKNEPASKKSPPVASQKISTGKPSPFAKISRAKAVKADSPATKPPTKVVKEQASTGTLPPKTLKISVTAAKPVQPAPGKKPEVPRPKKEFNIPPILLEGDSPVILEPKPSGPGRRYALAPEAPAPQLPQTAPELPESYGTGRLFLSARDPHWLYAAWDLPMQTQRELNSRSRDGHVVLRVFAHREPTTAMPEIHVHPESRTWFIYVPQAETRYHAELGYYDRHGEWHAISQSRSTFTPPDAPSQDVAAEFATIPAKITFQQLV